ncbi:MAG: alkaline phosphatase [Bacteroidota bacterium]
MKFKLSIICILLLGLTVSAQETNEKTKGNVVFIHPDGTSAAVWSALRMLEVGPDSNINWDLLPNIGVYLGHISDALTASSNAGGTIHAYGIKTGIRTYGMDDNHEIPTARSGKKMSIMQEAMKAGIKTGLINSGSIIEPGTGAFVVSVNKRSEDAEIAKQTIFSGVDVIMYGGEEWLLPEGVKGIYCQSGKRTDGLNLIEEAKKLGYYVIYTKEELINLPKDIDKVLGIFSEDHTFNDKTEEEQQKLHLENFKANTPTVAEMTKAAIKILSRNRQQFFLVVEEEGTDNFGNKNNASGVFEALKHADDALGVVLEFQKENPNTLLITCSDSEAGGMETIGFTLENLPIDKPVPKNSPNSSPYDGIKGSETLPFIAKPDKQGKVFPFVVAWSTTDDVSGSVLVRASGLNSEYVKGSVDNTDIYKFMYLTLFGKLIK